MKYYYILVFLISFNALGCSCSPKSLEENIKEADIISVGVLRSGFIRDKSAIEAEIEVSKILKGEYTSKFIKVTSFPEEDCSLPVTLNSTYVLFSKKEDGKVLTYFGLCLGSQKLDRFDALEYEKHINRILHRK